jgi:hypothetical protein
MEWSEELVVQPDGQASESFFSKKLIYGILIGVGIGAVANIAQYFYHKKQRQALLDEMVDTINHFECALVGQQTAANKKGEIIDISEFRVSRTIDLIQVINQQLYKNNLKGDERMKWVNAMQRLVRLSQKIQQKEVARNKDN